MLLRLIRLMALLALVIPVSWAQELPPPSDVTAVDVLEDPALLEKFTGTLSAEDEDNEELTVEEELFGDDSEADLEADESELSTHLLTFEFAAQFQFARQLAEGETEAPYLEVEYTANFETPILLDTRRRTIEIQSEYSADHWGLLAQNEFFDCKLNIEMPQLPVTVVSKINEFKTAGNNPDEETTEAVPPECAFQIKFSKKIQEDWFSFCTDIGGAQLNTQGGQEEYFIRSLQNIEPSLSALVINECDVTSAQTINLEVTPEIIEDSALGVDIALTGSGKINIEPY